MLDSLLDPRHIENLLQRMNSLANVQAKCQNLMLLGEDLLAGVSLPLRSAYQVSMCIIARSVRMAENAYGNRES